MVVETRTFLIMLNCVINFLKKNRTKNRVVVVSLYAYSDKKKTQRVCKICGKESV
jgi:hypothetical protein